MNYWPALRQPEIAVSTAPSLRYPVPMNENVAPVVNLPLPVRFRQYLRQLAYRIALYLLIYLVVSILTIGPCFWYWFEATYVNGPRWVAKFYAPLLWLCDHIWPLNWFVNHYINWWIQ